jgi:hypothetical protein
MKHQKKIVYNLKNPLNIQWKKARQKLNPSHKFREELRAELYENAVFSEQKFFEKFLKKITLPSANLILRIERRQPFFAKISQKISHFVRSFWRWIALAGGGALAAMVIIPTLSILTSSSLSASSKSYITNISGNISIERINNDFSPNTEEEILSGDTISSDLLSSGEIIFFEGSSIRLDANTTIKITDLNPQEGFFSSGGVEIEIVQGRIWVQTFHSPNETAAFLVKTNHSKIFPIRANLDIEYIAGKENIRVFENSAVVQLQGISLEKEITINQMEELFFTPFDTEINTQHIVENNSHWITFNQNRSAEHKQEYISMISAQMKEKFVAEELSARIHNFIAQDPSASEMEDMITQLNTVLLLNNKNKETEDLTAENTETEDEEGEQTGEEKENEKTSTAPARIKYSIPRKYTVKTTPSPVEEIIPEIEESDKMEEPEPEIKTGKELSKEFREKRKIETFEKAAENFSQQIDIFEFENSRKMQAQNILDSIPNDEENILLLDMIHEKSPPEVKEMIEAKKSEITGEEATEETPKEVEVKEDATQKIGEEKE